MDAETLDAMCHFFVRHTAYAGRAWDILDDSQSMVRIMLLPVEFCLVVRSSGARL